MHTLLSKALTEDDYVVIDDKPAFTQAGVDKHAKAVLAVYAPSIQDDVIYLCAECKRFVADKVMSVNAHRKVHRNNAARKQVARVEKKYARVAAAFALLPQQVQETLLRRVDEAQPETLAQVIDLPQEGVS